MIIDISTFNSANKFGFFHGLKVSPLIPGEYYQIFSLLQLSSLNKAKKFKLNPEI